MGSEFLPQRFFIGLASSSDLDPGTLTPLYFSVYSIMNQACLVGATTLSQQRTSRGYLPAAAPATSTCTPRISYTDQLFLKDGRLSTLRQLASLALLSTRVTSHISRSGQRSVERSVLCSPAAAPLHPASAWERGRFTPGVPHTVRRDGRARMPDTFIDHSTSRSDHPPHPTRMPMPGCRRPSDHH